MSAKLRSVLIVIIKVSQSFDTLKKLENLNETPELKRDDESKTSRSYFLKYLDNSL